MAFKNHTAAVLILLAITATSTLATVFQVGDSAGWTSDIAIGTDYSTLIWIDYSTWAHTNNFQVGDTLVFNYNKQFDNVMQVTEGDYIDCVTTSPLATYNSGSDAVTLDAPGDYYFISGFPNHCWNSNQKVHVVVAASSPSPHPPSPSPAPATSMSVTPSPSPNPPSPAPSTTHSALSSSGSPGNNHLSCVFLVFAAAVASFLVIV